MRENIKSMGLILAIAIAGVSLPTSIISIMSKPASHITEINNYYYNNTVIETYNNTIIERYNNTIIVIVNNTVIVNETIVELPPEPESEPFINRTRDWVDYDSFMITYDPPIYDYHIIDTYELGVYEWYFWEALSVGSGYSPKIIMIEEVYLNNFITLYQMGLGLDILPNVKATFPNNPYNVWYNGYWRPNHLANYTILLLFDHTEVDRTLDYRDMIWSFEL
jgi:hypothetical protein